VVGEAGVEPALPGNLPDSFRNGLIRPAA